MLLSAAAVCTAVLSAYPAAADPIDTSLMLSISLLNGDHEVGRGEDNHFTALPLPLTEIDLRHDHDAIRIEGAIPIEFSSSDNDGSTSSTRLSLLNATYRRTIGNGWYVGAGETSYNQTTVYTAESEKQSSRVTGVRYEIGRDWKTRHGRVEVNFALNPAMYGPIVTTYTFNPQFPFSFSDPERATQIDAMIRASTRISRHAEFVYSVRYLNLTSRYADAPGYIADRDVGFTPAVGIREHF
jgi:hypothetical protein